MFTGIIKKVFPVFSIIKVNESLFHFKIKSETPFLEQIKIGDSVSHDGVCLTVNDINYENLIYQVSAVHETLQRTNLQSWKEGYLVNIEPALRLNEGLDGHIVQGHIDIALPLLKIEEFNQNKHLYFPIPQEFQSLVVEKGSITINGVSLTVAKDLHDHLMITIIPHTWEHTNLKYLSVGSIVNVEYDILAKYLLKSYKVQFSN